ncbi:MAG TPA: hypothetical protein VFK80_02165, partial [Limnochordia bacterium]|nr:hypothetical protein [Limnochordia bacterium]
MASMRCPHCGEEIALAAVCPYCNRPAGAPREDSGHAAPGDEARGTFRGRMEPEGGDRPRKRGVVAAFLAFMSDPKTAGWKKALVIAAGIFMVFPDLFIPVAGWFDDGIIGFFLVRWLLREL